MWMHVQVDVIHVDVGILNSLFCRLLGQEWKSARCIACKVQGSETTHRLLCCSGWVSNATPGIARIDGACVYEFRPIQSGGG